MRALILACALMMASAPALAGQAVTLKSETLDGDGVVTLGDLFDGAGGAGKIAVATRPGVSVVLDAGSVQQAARRAGLDWANAEGVRRIIVRAGVDGGTSPAASRGNVEVLTYARSLATGEVLQPQDLVWAKAAAPPNDTPRDAEAIIGLAAKRPLRAGSVVSVRDVAAAVVIKAGDIVTVIYESDGITLSLEGKAVAGAAIGDPVAVLNTASKKTIQATASGPGRALVGPAAETLKTQARLQYAQR